MCFPGLQSASDTTRYHSQASMRGYHLNTAYAARTHTGKEERAKGQADKIWARAHAPPPPLREQLQRYHKLRKQHPTKVLPLNHRPTHINRRLYTKE